MKNLQAFTAALAGSDTQVRAFNTQLAQVAGELADERGSLGLALKNLTAALQAVAGFVKSNKDALHTSITGLEDVTGVLVKQKAAIAELLAVAPVGLANLGHTYSGVEAGTPADGTLDSRTNLSELADPAVICGLLNGLGKLGTGGKLDLKNQADLVCSSLAKQLGCLIDPLTGSTPLGGLLLPACTQDQTPGLPGLPKIPGVAAVTGK